MSQRLTTPAKSTIDTEVIDLDGDGVADAVVETTTTVIDLDGDGVADVVQETTTTAIDLDGDGEVDIIDETTITAVDVDGDGEFSEDEIEVEEPAGRTRTCSMTGVAPPKRRGSPELRVLGDLAAEQLAGGVAGELVDEGDVAGDLVAARRAATNERTSASSSRPTGR